MLITADEARKGSEVKPSSDLGLRVMQLLNDAIMESMMWGQTDAHVVMSPAWTSIAVAALEAGGYRVLQKPGEFILDHNLLVFTWDKEIMK